MQADPWRSYQLVRSLPITTFPLSIPLYDFCEDAIKDYKAEVRVRYMRMVQPQDRRWEVVSGEVGRFLPVPLGFSPGGILIAKFQTNHIYSG